jgi:hypothetical protein
MSTAGAYGIRLAGLPLGAPLTQAAPETWTLWRVHRDEGRAGDSSPAHAAIGSAKARVPVVPEGVLLVDRGSTNIVYRTSEPVADEALIHPYLAPAAAIVASWAGRISFHGAAFVVDGGAWLVLAGSAAGKSVLGLTVLSDDLLVVDHHDIMTGPRCLDLRCDAAEHLGIGTPLGVVGGRERWRVRLGLAPAVLPIRGFVTLAWAEEASVETCPARMRLAELMRHRAIERGASDVRPCLDLAARPMLQFARPRRLCELEAGIELLLQALPGEDHAAAEDGSTIS